MILQLKPEKLKTITLFIVYITMVSLFTACKQQPNVAINNENEAVVIPDDFLPFYQDFLKDTTYQMQHILFPLFGKTDSTKWQKSEWIYHKPLKINREEYHHDLENMGGVMTERILDKQGLFAFIRRYAKTDGEWYLIYYSEKNNLDGFKLDQ